MRIPRFQRFHGFVGFQVPLLLAAAGAVCLAVAIAACSHESPVAPAAATGPCAYIVFPTAVRVSTVAGTFHVSVGTTAASGGCRWTASTSDAWIHVVGAASGQVTTDVTIAVDAAVTARQGTVTVSWAGGSQSIAVTQSCDVTRTVNVPAEGQEFTVSAPASACSLPVSSVSVDVPWISVRGPFPITHPPPVLPPDSFDGIVGVNTGPERTGHVTTPIGQVTVIQSAGNCVMAIAPTSQAFDENGGAGSFSVTAVPGCAWDATSHTPTGLPYDITPLTAHGIGSGVVPFTVAANGNTFARAWSYLVGGSLTFQITQSRCPATVSPLNFHVGAADSSFSIAVTSRDFCYWGVAYVLPIAKFITLAAPGETVRGSGTVQFSVAQNQTGQARSGSLSVAEQIVTVTQDP